MSVAAALFDRIRRRERARARGRAWPPAGRLHRLEQIVDGVQLEGLDRVLVEGGDEGDQRQRPAATRGAPRRGRPSPASADRAAPDRAARARSARPPPRPIRASPTSWTPGHRLQQSVRNRRAGRSSSATRTRSVAAVIAMVLAGGRRDAGIEPRRGRQPQFGDGRCRRLVASSVSRAALAVVALAAGARRCSGRRRRRRALSAAGSPAARRCCGR